MMEQMDYPQGCLISKFASGNDHIGCAQRTKSY